jgi:hypothetical protein
MKLFSALVIAVPFFIATASFSASTETLLREPTVIEDSISFTRINAGINPRAVAYSLSGRVKLGSNPCIARGVEARLEKSRRGKTIYVTPVLRFPPDFQRRICTMEYNPVYTTVSTEVRYLRNTVSDVIIKNVGEKGNNVSAFSFLVD